MDKRWKGIVSILRNRATSLYIINHKTLVETITKQRKTILYTYRDSQHRYYTPTHIRGRIHWQQCKTLFVYSFPLIFYKIYVLTNPAMDSFSPYPSCSLNFSKNYTITVFSIICTLQVITTEAKDHYNNDSWISNLIY
jgi:hypothetical protein